jgi:hypothetical protein
VRLCYCSRGCHSLRLTPEDEDDVEELLKDLAQLKEGVGVYVERLKNHTQDEQQQQQPDYSNVSYPNVYRYEPFSLTDTPNVVYLYEYNYTLAIRKAYRDVLLGRDDDDGDGELGDFLAHAMANATKACHRMPITSNIAI